MAVTKTSKTPPREYAVWQAVLSDFSVGDIIDVSASLGGRTPSTLTIDSPDGDSQVKFNVTQRVYKNHKERGNDGSFPYAAFYRSPVLVDEIEVDSDTVVISTGSVHTYTDLAIDSIKIIAAAASMRIIAE